MARGNKTSKIPRASFRTRTRKKSSRGGSKGRVSRAIADHTRPTPRSERIIPRVLGRVVLGIGLLVILASFLNSFLLAPGRTWFGQRTEIADRQAELETIQKANDELQVDIDRLQTPAGVEDAAREELGFVMAGEERQTIIGDAQSPIDLPGGWPYDIVTRIVGVRESEAAAEAAARAAEAADDSSGGTPRITDSTVPVAIVALTTVPTNTEAPSTTVTTP